MKVAAKGFLCMNTGFLDESAHNSKLGANVFSISQTGKLWPSERGQGREPGRREGVRGTLRAGQPLASSRLNDYGTERADTKGGGDSKAPVSAVT